MNIQTGLNKEWGKRSADFEDGKDYLEVLASNNTLDEEPTNTKLVRSPEKRKYCSIEKSLIEN